MSWPFFPKLVSEQTILASPFFFSQVGVNKVDNQSAWVSLEMAETSNKGGAALPTAAGELVNWIAISTGAHTLPGAKT